MTVRQRRRSTTNTTMQSEVFLTLVVVILLLFFMALIKERELAEREGQLAEELQRVREKEQPPLITLDEASGYAFRSGSFALDERFRRILRQSVIPEIDREAQEHKCDVLEVYGYTDGQPHRVSDVRRARSLDGDLLDALVRRRNPARVQTMSNAELGFMRAVAVASFLRRVQAENEQLQSIKVIRPYSGGQMTMPDGHLADPRAFAADPQRRRIELRLSRLRDLTPAVSSTEL